MILSDRHISLESSNDVKEICKPLMESFNINYFRYLRTYEDGSRICLSTNPIWTTHFFEKCLYKVAWFDNQPINCYQTGYKIWDDKALLEDNDVGRDSRDGFNMHHGLTIIRKNSHNKYCEFFDFTTSEDNNKINYLYNQASPAFNQFTFYFLEKAKNLILKSNQQRIILTDLDIKNSPTGILNSEINDFVSDIQVRRYYVGENTYLTNKEVQVIFQYSRGHQTKVIADNIGVSPRTVEGHLDNARRKTNCRNTTDLVCFCIHTGIIDVYWPNDRPLIINTP